MAFTGVADVVAVGTYNTRIKGLSLAGGASGTISLESGAGGVKLPVNFPAMASADLVRVAVTPIGAGTAAHRISVVKTDSPFLVTITNNDGANATSDLDIEVSFIHSSVR